MPLILHLSDMHLTDPTNSPPLGDYKAGLVPERERLTIFAVLQLTLTRLRDRLLAEGRTLDCIVVSGDVADRNKVEGYKAFLSLLGALGDVAPAPGHIVVVPGNHDVRSRLRPGDPARYKNFAEAIRGAGFVTPLLDGIDTDVPTIEEDVLKHVARFDDVEVIPLNSSAYAQVEVSTEITGAQWEAMEKALRDAGGDEKAVRALERCRFVDAARMSERQLEDVRSMLSTRQYQTRSALGAGGGLAFPLPLRVAVFHHQLQPVSEAEEVKPYESFTNLERLRQFLSDNSVSIVLHGHKHAPFTYEDYVFSYDAPEREPRRIRVIAGPAPSGSTFNQADVCRLLDIDASVGSMTIEPIAAASPGRASERGESTRVSFVRPGAATTARTTGASIIDGETAAAAYVQLVARVAEVDGEVENVICRVARAPREIELSDLYRGFSPQSGSTTDLDDDGDEPQRPLEQFEELVTWWQFPAAPLSPVDQPAFTHGSRIYRYNGHHDQVAEVTDALCSDPDTSRAVIVLLNPIADKIATKEPFPSFCLAQFTVRQPGGGSAPRLDCVAFFRKQEVRYWWLVNVAELVRLQRKLSDALSARTTCLESLAGIEPGSITTVAARAHAGQSPPKVQVPRIDRYYTFAREKLAALVNALVWSEMPGRDAYGEEWVQVFLELEPPEKQPGPGGVAVALEGLRFVRDEVQRHLAEPTYANDAGLQELAKVLDDLYRGNERYALDQRAERVTPPRYAAWRATVKRLLERVMELTTPRIVARKEVDTGQRG